MAGFYEFESSRMAAERSPVRPGGLAGRYSDEDGTAPAGAAPVQPSTGPAEADLYAQNAILARSGANDVARFAMMDLASYQNRVQRAVRDNDADALAAVTSEIDGFVDEHANELAEWTALSGQGRQGQLVASRVQAVLDGSYKDMWGVADANGAVVRNARTVLDDDSEEYKARRASRVSREQGIGTAMARAIVDRDDAMHPVFSRFSDLASSVASGSVPRPQVPGLMSRGSRSAFLHGVSSVAGEVGVGDGAFSSWDDMGRFVDAFDRLVNKDGAYAGDAVLRKVADGYVSGNHGLSANDYVAQYGALVDRLTAQAVGAQDGKGATRTEARLSRHEANAIASEFVSLLDKVDGAVLGPEWSSALESAAATVRMADDMFGVVSRGGKGYARRVAVTAAAAMGAPNMDDGGLNRFVSDAASDLSSIVSSPTRDLMATMAEGKGRAGVGTVKAPNPYSNVEMFAVKALGRAMRALGDDGVDGQRPAGRNWGDLKAFAASNETARGKLVDAMATALDRRFGDRRLSETLAGGMVDRFLGLSDDGRTLEERLRGWTGDFDPVTDEPEVPPAVRLSPGMKDDDFNAVLATMAADPTRVVPVLRGEKAKGEKGEKAKGGLPAALGAFARDTLDRAGKKDPAGSMRWHRSLGRLAVAAGVDDSSGLVGSGLLTRLALSPEKFELQVLPGADREQAQRALRDGVQAIVGRGGDLSMDDAVTLAIVLGSDVWKAHERSLLPTEKLGEQARQLLAAKFNVPKSAPKETALRVLANNPRFRESTLVSSGLVDAATGAVSYKGLLANMQRQGFASVYTDKAKARPSADTELQRAARRVYRSFGTRDDEIARLKSDVLEHYRAQGLRGEELIDADTVVSNRLADVYRNGGPAAAAALARKMVSRRRRYFPVFAPDGKTLVPDAVQPSDSLLTDAEFLEEVEKRKAARAAVNLPTDDAVFYNADLTGPSTFRHNQETAEKVALYRQTHPAADQ